MCSCASIIRHPLILLLLGVSVAGFGGLFSYTIIEITKESSLSGVFPNSRLAAHLVGLILSSTGAGMIASAIISKAKKAYDGLQKESAVKIIKIFNELESLEARRDKIKQEEIHNKTQEEIISKLNAIVDREEKLREKIYNLRKKSDL